MEQLYRRADNEDRGRHLVANCALERGRLVLVERPLLALPSLDNQRYHALCHCCLAFVGGPQSTLRRRIGIMGELPPGAVPCRGGCGHLYCSQACEKDAWQAHHFCLCTGQCESDQDALVRFKHYCVETNEILLLVAEWWVSQYTTLQRNDASRHQSYTDFQMNPWWSVLTAETMIEHRPGSSAEASQLQTDLENVCNDAADLLNQVFADKGIPAITALDISVRVGACEQNAMGIRQRSPLCRDVFDLLLSEDVDEEIRRALVRCLDEADFIGGGDDEEEAGGSSEVSNASIDDETGDGKHREDWNYSAKELAEFISNLRVDEDGSVRDLAVPFSGSDEFGIGDDLDKIFPPLDGTAMYSITCKMNHSCDPNIMVVYRRLPGWGENFPLTAFCVARRDIQVGEELTISYIDANDPFENRAKELSNYGFVCHCNQCDRERKGDVNGGGEDKALTMIARPEGGDAIGVLFDSDSDDDEYNRYDDDDEQADIGDGYDRLQRLQGRLDSIANHSRFGHLPQKTIGPVASFVVRTTKHIFKDIEAKNTELSGLLLQCVTSLEKRDYCLAKIVGGDLESSVANSMKRAGRFSDPSERLLYWVAALTSAIGLSHDYNFLEAQKPLDKAYTLGLNSPTSGYMDLLRYVEEFSTRMSRGPVIPAIKSTHDIPDESVAEQIAVASEVRFPVRTISLEISSNDFASIVSNGEIVAFRKLALHWKAIECWRNIGYLCDIGGHREVPVELGSMLSGGMGESFMKFRRFAENYLLPSNRHGVWSLEDSAHISKVAYIAQHPLQGQISALKDDIGSINFLQNPPAETMMWVGTGGTRTPLHFDTYDNLFVQVVGYKYIRLYSPDQTPKLYVNHGTFAKQGNISSVDCENGTFAKQGNMSTVDCENEDFVKHALLADAVYTDIVLGPGDSLFIPASTWHYVRSLTTSISVNFWF